VIAAAVDVLLAAQNPDGGWGWTKGRRSTTECSSLALLALKSFSDDIKTGAIRKGLDWLCKNQNSNGSWPLNDNVKDGSWTTALAILALDAWPEHEAAITKGGRWALMQYGNKPGLLANVMLALSFRKKPVMLNEDLVGWPWMTGTFSWVEPTSYFLIALKRIRRHLLGTNVDERIAQGESMIYDRMCVGGGWNYGNSVVYGEKLWPYADTTAIALIALQNHSEAQANRLSFAALQNGVNTVASGLALSWAVLCYDVYGRDSAELRKRLNSDFETTAYLGENKSLALYVLALTGGAKYLRT
jgi:hypothetical protein